MSDNVTQPRCVICDQPYVPRKRNRGYVDDGWCRSCNMSYSAELRKYAGIPCDESSLMAMWGARRARNAKNNKGRSHASEES